MMPSGGHRFASHDVQRADIQRWQQNPRLEGQDRGDEAEHHHAAASPHDLDAQHEKPGEGAADPLNPIQRMEDQAPDAESVFQFNAWRLKFQRSFDEADGADKAQPKQADDESVESKAAHEWVC